MTTKETVEDKILRGLCLFCTENRVLDKIPPRPTTPRFSSIDYDGFSCGATRAGDARVAFVYSDSDRGTLLADELLDMSLIQACVIRAVIRIAINNQFQVELP